MAARSLMPKVISLVLRVAVGGLFVFAGALKAWDPQQFRMDVQDYQLTSWDVSIVIAIYLPWVEIFAGAALIVRRLQLGALIVLSGLITAFLVAIGSAWHRGLDISCGCFGKETIAANYPALIARDVAILAALAVLTWMEWRAARALPMPSVK